MTLPIDHETDKCRFSTTVDSHLCVLEYELTGKVMTITHIKRHPEYAELTG